MSKKLNTLAPADDQSLQRASSNSSVPLAFHQQNTGSMPQIHRHGNAQLMQPGVGGGGRAGSTLSQNYNQLLTRKQGTQNPPYE